MNRSRARKGRGEASYFSKIDGKRRAATQTFLWHIYHVACLPCTITFTEKIVLWSYQVKRPFLREMFAIVPSLRFIFRDQYEA